MNNFVIKKGPFLKSSCNTSIMMNNIIISLIPLVLFSIFKNGIIPLVNGYGNFFTFIKPIMVIAVPIIICCLCEYMYCYLSKDKEIILYKNYAIIPGIILGLIIPLNTPIWLIIVSSIILSIFRLLSGLGKNIFNPSLVGLVFVLGGCYFLDISFLNIYELNSNLTSPLTNLMNNNYFASYDKIVLPYGSLFNFFLGNVPGLLGTTSTILCLISILYLIKKKCIKVLIPIITIGLFFFSSLIIGLMNGLGIWYPLFNVMTGGFFFAIIYLASDNVTTPIGIKSEIIYSLLLVIILLIIHYLTCFIEYAIFITIAIMNIMTILIDKLILIVENKEYFSNLIISLLIIVLLIVIGIIGM